MFGMFGVSGMFWGGDSTPFGLADIKAEPSVVTIIDPSMTAAMYSDRAGTVPISGVGDYIGKVIDQSGKGNHAVAPSDGERPVLAVDADGYYFIDTSGGKSLVVTFGASLGSSCDVLDAYRGWGSVTRSSVTIGTTYTINYGSAITVVSSSALTAQFKAKWDKYANARCSVPVALTYAVDSVNGSDSNDGLSPFAAKQTIAALPTHTAGMRVGLARGSSWREQFGGSVVVDNVTVRGYGAGKLPVLDAADTLGAVWTKTGGLTNIYQTTVALPAGMNNFFVSVWQDSTRMRWVANTAACDSTPGSYYVAPISGVTATVYMYPTGGGDPNLNGKVYEYSARAYGLTTNFTPNGWDVRYIHTKRSISHSGSLHIAGVGYVKGCLAEDGTVHNVFVGAGSTVEDTIVWKCDLPIRGSNATMFIVYGNGAGKTTELRRCIAIASPSMSLEAIAAGKDISGFYAHAAGAPAGNHERIVYSDCSVFGTVSGFSAEDCNYNDVVRCYVESASEAFGVAALNYSNVDSFYKDGTAYRTLRGMAFYRNGSTNVVNGLRGYSKGLIGNTAGFLYSTYTPNVTLTRSAYHIQGTGFVYQCVRFTNASAVVNVSGVAFRGDTNSVNEISSSAHQTIDYSVYNVNTFNFTVDGVAYYTFATYRAAHPELDANSVILDPQFADPENGNFTPTNPGFPSWAGCERPNITYTAVPSDAALDAM